jgi:succinyl-diaminopimelate desuccinylase
MPSSSLRDELVRRVDAAGEHLIAATQRLVAVASPNPPSDTHGVAEIAQALLLEIPGIEVERVEPAPRVVSLVGRIRGARPGRRLIFNGHLDTFPIREDLAWTVPPLGGVLKDGKLYGRGVCDMKGGIACSLLAAMLLAEHRDAWAGEIVLTLAGDEENMGSLGTGYMLEHIPHALGDANICGDVGSPRIVRFGEKGLMWVEVEATGSPAHGAHVHRGTNAIDRLRRALDRLKELEAIPFRAPAAVTEAISNAKVISEALSGAGEADTLSRVTVNIGTLSGGTSPNLVPTHAIAHADIRLPVGITPTCWRKSSMNG